MRPILPVTLSALALLASGCGGDDADSGGGGDAAAPAPAGDLVTIAMKDIVFKPKNQTVKVGQTVKWVNEDTVDHNAVAEDEAMFKSELFGKGGTFEVTLDTPGTIKYVCTIHPAMTGSLIVVE